MRSVRVFYKKGGRMKFVSHLDMNRFMTRVLYKSGLPIWFTEGYNPHPYLTFALPLSLGFESEYEIMDIRMNDDSVSDEEILKAISDACPEYIKVFKVCEPVLKAGKVAFAEFEINFDTDSRPFFDSLDAFLNKESYICTKTTKKGKIKEFDIIPKIKKFEICGNCLKLILPAGSEDNLNPTVILDAFFENCATEYCHYDIIRTKILDSDMNLFV